MAWSAVACSPLRLPSLPAIVRVTVADPPVLFAAAPAPPPNNTNATGPAPPPQKPTMDIKTVDTTAGAWTCYRLDGTAPGCGSTGLLSCKNPDDSVIPPAADGSPGSVSVELTTSVVAMACTCLPPPELDLSGAGTGCTGAIAKLLQKLGVNISHEHLSQTLIPHGLSSWVSTVLGKGTFRTEDGADLEPRCRRILFLMQVRHPRSVLRSVNGARWDFSYQLPVGVTIRAWEWVPARAGDGWA